MIHSSIVLASSGFGLNFNVFETNLINLVVVIFGLYKFLPNFLGKILEKRRSSILVELEDAQVSLDKAKDALSKAKSDLDSAEIKAKKIKSDSLVRAEAIKKESEERTILEMARIKEGAVADLQAEASRVSTQLKKEIAKLAIEKALKKLPATLDKSSQDKFLESSLQNLGDI